MQVVRLKHVLAHGQLASSSAPRRRDVAHQSKPVAQGDLVRWRERPKALAPLPHRGVWRRASIDQEHANECSLAVRGRVSIRSHAGHMYRKIQSRTKYSLKPDELRIWVNDVASFSHYEIQACTYYAWQSIENELPKMH